MQKVESNLDELTECWNCWGVISKEDSIKIGNWIGGEVKYICKNCAKKIKKRNKDGK